VGHLYKPAALLSSITSVSETLHPAPATQIALARPAVFLTSLCYNKSTYCWAIILSTVLAAALSAGLLSRTALILPVLL
jgi:hypothetical protein